MMMTRTKLQRCIAITGVVFLVLLALIHTLPGFFLRTNLYIEVQSRQADTYQVFYDTAKGYNEAESVVSSLRGSGVFETIRFRLPGKKINKIRIDPGTKPVNMLIRKICINSLLRQRCWTGQDLLQYTPMHDISKFEVTDGLLSITSTGGDPYFEFKGDFSRDQSVISSYYLYPVALLLSLVLFSFLYWEDSIIRVIDAGLPVLKKVIRYRYVIALALFIILVAAKLHGSSLPMWDLFIKEKIDPSEKSLLLGKPRGVRSDDWVVQTPMYLSQTQSKGFFPVINPNIRSDGENMLVSYYAPVFDITLIGKPFNWGFLLLGKEYGLSWYWWSKLLLLLLISYEVCLLLTRGNELLSALGAFWIAFSPFVQWWFTTPLVDLIIYSQALIVAACSYLTAANRRTRLFLAVALASCATGFILSFYPPFQVSLGYLVLLFVSVYAYVNKADIRLGKHDLALLSISLIAVIAIIVSFAAQSMDAIKLMYGTVYPGKRFVTGGGYDANILQFYLINWLTPFKEVRFLNRCEVATFLNFIPAGLLVFYRVYRKDSMSRTLGFALLCYILFQFSWLFFHYPDWFARWSFYFAVPQYRLQEVVSLAAVYPSIWMFSLLAEHKPLKLSEVFVISLFSELLYVYSLKHTFMFEYLGPLNAALTLVIFFMGNCFFLLGKKRLFSLFVLLFVVVAGVTVNPLSRGVGPIYNKVIARKTLEINSAHPGQKWAAVNSPVLGNFLIALGVKSLNSVQYYPDLKAWKILDPGGKYEQSYNRYAHVWVQVATGETHFEVKQDDAFILYITPEDLRKVGVRYVLSNGVLPVQSPIMKEIDKVEGDNLYIYEVQA